MKRLRAHFQSIQGESIILLSLKRLSPFYLYTNSIMFVDLIAALSMTVILLRDILFVPAQHEPLWFTASLTIWIWITLFLANLSEAIAEGKGKAHASSLKSLAQEVSAHLQTGVVEKVIPASDLRRGDIVKVSAGEYIPADGEILEGIASIDESAITGESAPVIRESDSDRSSVTAGTQVLSNFLIIQISSNPGETYLDQMIRLVHAAKRQKTPNEISLQILLIGLTLIFLIVCAVMVPLGLYFDELLSLVIVISLLVCLVPTTIGGLASAVGISGIDRALKRNILAMSGKAVELAGDIDVLLLDKTGTVTLGNRMPFDLIPFKGVSTKELVRAIYLSTAADRTPEGRSVLEFIEENYTFAASEESYSKVNFIPFSAETRMSGCDMGKTMIRKGACDAIEQFVKNKNGKIPDDYHRLIEEIGLKGGTPLAIAKGNKILGILHLKDIIKPGIRERFQRLKAMGIRTIMITGDNPFTAKSIAEEVGVDEYLAEATPEKKMELIREQQQKGYLVAMTGDGTNDAPALAQADLGIAMNSGTQSAKEAANMVDLDSNPTKILEVIEIGKQLLMTRGCLTTFSIATDIAKYFAIIPPIFMLSFPELRSLNLMQLASPYSAILSTVIFSALTIIILLPLAMKGVKYRPLGAKHLLVRFLFIYGIGGIIAPFIGIKLIDMLCVNLGFV